MGKKRCIHLILFLSAHHDFQNGWLCCDCGQQIHEPKDMNKRGVCFAAMLTPPQRKKGRGK